jgi:fatty acid desaturase
MCRPSKNERSGARPSRAAAAAAAVAAGARAPAARPLRPDEVWYLHGRAYDLTRFAARHPGGLRNIILGRGRDATEIFESVHVTGDMARARAVLEKYRCKEMDAHAPEPTFTFADDGMYAAITADVRRYFRDTGLSPKGNPGYWWRTALQLVLHAAALYTWCANGSLAGCFFSGLLAVSLGFSLFHTASHSGLSRDWRVNDFWSFVWGDLTLGFFRSMWLLHHVYGHHAYTGVMRKDPDLANAQPIARKNPSQRWKDKYRVQWVTNYLLYLVLPGQWFGNLVQYIRSIVLLHVGSPAAKIFGIPLKKGEALLSEIYPFMGIVTALFVILTLRFSAGFALATCALHSVTRSFFYWAIVFPNHETDLVEHAHTDADWGQQQITHSADFYVPPFVTALTGGMQHQIEHHLFPAVHHEHYPAISRIVRKHCTRLGVQYNYHPSWFSALKGNFNLHRALSTQDGGFAAHSTADQAAASVAAH